MKQQIFFDKIYVIESLDSFETSTGQILHNDLIRHKVLLMPGFLSEFNKVNSREEFIDLMDRIYQETKMGLNRPYLHFEIHGCKEGIVLNNGDLITWNDLYGEFHKINAILRNQLFISLATCYGGYIFNVIDPLKQSPFFGFVGNVREVTSGEVEIGFYEYFDTLLSSLDIDEAIDALNNANPDMPHPFISMISEEIFAKVASKLNAQMSSRQAKLAKRKELEKRAKEDPEIRMRYTRKQLKEKMKLAVKNRSNDLKKYQDYFLFKGDNPAI